MRKQWIKWLGLVVFSWHLTACGTITSLVESDYSAYGGVSRDFQAIQEGGVFSVVAVIDLPLSFVLDTLMLPVTLSR